MLLISALLLFLVLPVIVQLVSWLVLAALGIALVVGVLGVLRSPR